MKVIWDIEECDKVDRYVTIHTLPFSPEKPDVFDPLSMPSPYFIITIDTEGDNLWERPELVTNENVKFLPRFQGLVEKYSLKSTYLTNFEMAKSKEFQKFGLGVIREGSGEIGTHLHAWNSPPMYSLTANDSFYMPYLFEYPEEIMHKKLTFLTDYLESVFGVKMTSHRAGRWGFDERYAKMLVECGYLVDSSITPHISWKSRLGDPEQSGGSNYYNFPENCYRIDLDDISKASTSSSLLEVPVTVTYLDGIFTSGLRRMFSDGSIPARVLNRLISGPCTLRPNGSNLEKMLLILKKCVREEWPCVLFMLHSSEFMPGGSPSFTDSNAIDKLYAHLDMLFMTAHRDFEGCTLSEFRRAFGQQGSEEKKRGKD